MNEYRQFRVYDEANPLRKGDCRSYHTHFEIDWDDGQQQRGIMDLADIGVAKTFEEDGNVPRRSPRRPQKFA